MGRSRWHAHPDVGNSLSLYGAKPMREMNSHFTVRRATPADLELVRQTVSQVHGRVPVDDAAVAGFLSDPACYLILAVEGDTVLGSLNGYALRRPHRPDPQFLLYEIDVRWECRNQGIGRALVMAFAAEARAACASGQWVVTNESNSAAMAMYRVCGYRRVNPDDVMLVKAPEQP